MRVWVVLVVLSMASCTWAERITIKGRVVGPQGEGVTGAKVAVGKPFNWNTRRTESAPLVSVMSGDNGRFELSYEKEAVAPWSSGGGASGRDMWKQVSVLAVKEGLGVGWCQFDRVDEQGDVVLKMAADDVPIEGRVVDEKGKGVAGVKVLVSRLYGGTREEVEKLWETDEEAAGAMLLWAPLSSAGIEPVVTDGDGRFVLRGLGRDRLAELRVSGKEIGYAGFSVLTRRVEESERTVDQPAGYGVKFKTYGAKFEYVARPGQTVQGQVRDSATGDPIAGMTVKSYRFAGEFQGYDPEGLISTETDAEGRYKLEGFPAGEGNSILIEPREGQPYFPREGRVPDGGRFRSSSVEVELDRGVVVRGRVTDRKTGKPVAARVMYTTYRNNKNVDGLGYFNGEQGYLEGRQGQYETREDGSYSVVAAPGKAIVGVWVLEGGYRKGKGFEELSQFKLGDRESTFTMFHPSPYPEGTNAVREIDIPQGVAEAECDLEVDPGDKITVRVIDEAGKPLEGLVRVRGQDAENYSGASYKRESAAAFELNAVTKGEIRTVYVIDETRGLGAAMAVKTGEVLDQMARKMDIKVRPLCTLRGRVLNGAGVPLKNLALEIEPAGPGSKSVRMIKTDGDGRWEARVPVGMAWYVGVWSGPYVGRTVAREVVAKAGEVVEVPEARIELQKW